jgi:hypothetical protein
MEGKRFAEKIKRFPGTVSRLQSEEMAKDAASQNAEIDKILAKPEFAKIDRAFEAFHIKRGYDQDWYIPYGPTSIAKLASDVGMDVHYAVFYNKYSEIMHSSGFFDHVHVDEKGVSIEQIRTTEHFDEVVRMASTTAVDVFETIIKRYRSGELKSFHLKYAREWRDRFLKIPKVVINRT